MNIACIVLASGSGVRFGKSKSKLFYNVYGTPIVEYTLKNITKYFNRSSIYITIPKKITKNQKIFLSKYSKNRLIPGGKERVDSLINAIKEVNLSKYQYVLIHDAARPLTSKKIFMDMINVVKSKKYDCIIPCSIVEDTLRKKTNTVDRSLYSIYQTPQVFKFELLNKNINNKNKLITDDLGFLERKKNLKIKYVKSDKENIKITHPSDIKLFKKLISYKYKIGNGFDIHMLSKGTYLSLAGLKIKSKYRSVGHSDGDVVIHSIIDAILGANNKGDIGKSFPAIKKFKDISSTILLNQLQKKVGMNNIIIDNLDCTIICQKIRLEKYKKQIAKNISNLLDCNSRKVSVKAKTADQIGLIGKSKAIACWTTLKLINL